MRQHAIRSQRRPASIHRARGDDRFSSVAARRNDPARREDRRSETPFVICRASLIALLLLVAYAVSASMPCPPPPSRVPISTALMSSAGEAPDERGGAGDALSITAVCHCGCESQRSVPGARVGAPLQPELARETDRPAAAARLVAVELRPAPEAPARAIDHVPLAG